MKLVLDTETNGLLNRSDLKLLCVVAKVLETGEVHRFHLHGHPDCLVDSQRLWNLLARTTVLIGHNVSGFDIHVLQRHLGKNWKPKFRLYDTMAISRLRFIGDIAETTWSFRNRFRDEAQREAAYPSALTHPSVMHKLASWGYRLGIQKGSYLDSAGVQESWSQALEDYCLQDVLVTEALFYHLQVTHQGRPAPPFEVCLDESHYCFLLSLQELGGVFFNEGEAVALYAKLCGRRDALASELKAAVAPWYRPGLTRGDPAPEGLLVAPGDAPLKVSKVTYKVPYPNPLAGRAAGSAYTPIELCEFNPASRPMIASMLTRLYGWRPDPTKLTPGGDVQVDEGVLSGLDYPIVPLLLEYLITEKTCGMLSEGKEAWLKHSLAGRIHGRVISTGARTTRCAHSKPNLAQVPKVWIHPGTGAPLLGYDGHYGAECRGLFGARPGWVMVGCDAAGLELRCLGHRLAYYDNGLFAETLLHGDVHGDWQKKCGLYFRDNQKTLTYAFLYGAGNKKLGKIVVDDLRQAAASGSFSGKVPGASREAGLGAAVRGKLLGSVPGLDGLLKACAVAHERGWVKLVDGTSVVCKSAHGTLNDVLQGDGARMMKRAKVLLSRALEREGLDHGLDFEWLLDVHDEWQVGCPPEEAQRIGALMAASIADAGTSLALRIPLLGGFKVGSSWKETH
jgi:hypothetical protein